MILKFYSNLYKVLFDDKWRLLCLKEILRIKKFFFPFNNFLPNKSVKSLRQGVTECGRIRQKEKCY